MTFALKLKVLQICAGSCGAFSFFKHWFSGTGFVCSHFPCVNFYHMLFPLELRIVSTMFTPHHTRAHITGEALPPVFLSLCKKHVGLPVSQFS